MKYFYTLIFLIFMVATTQPTVSQTRKTVQSALQGFTMGQSFQFGGREYSYSLTAAEMKNTPSWNPQISDPPLSIKKAISLGQDGLKNFVKNGEKWRLPNRLSLIQPPGVNQKVLASHQ